VIGMREIKENEKTINFYKSLKTILNFREQLHKINVIGLD